MPIFHQCEQRSLEWHTLRTGIITASSFDKIVTPKGKLSEQHKKHLIVLVTEWWLGCQLDTPETNYMEIGTDREPESVASYEFETGRETSEIGFVSSDDGMIGCSPDRLVGESGILELKNPAAQTHMGYLLSRAIEDEYKPQLQGNLYVCQRDWIDVQSYYPALPSVIIRVVRDEEYIATLSDALAKFVDLLLEARLRLTREYGVHPKSREVAKEPPGELGVSEEDVAAIWAGRTSA